MKSTHVLVSLFEYYIFSHYPHYLLFIYNPSLQNIQSVDFPPEHVSQLVWQIKQDLSSGYVPIGHLIF